MKRNQTSRRAERAEQQYRGERNDARGSEHQQSNLGDTDMDPKMYEINNLRVLNDYLNQTIDVLVRAQRFGQVPFAGGLSHSPYAAGSIFGSPVLNNLGVDPTGLSHSQYAAAQYAATTPFTSPFAPNGVAPFAQAVPVVLDPFSAQRGLAHSTIGANLWHSWPIAEIARQSQLTQALAARQQVLETMCRSVGIPV